MERDGVGIDDLHALHDAIRARAAAEPGIEKTSKGIRDVFRRQLAAVVEQNAVPQSRNIGALVRVLERLGEFRRHLQVRVDVDQRVKEELIGLLRCLVQRNAGIEIRRGVCRRDNDRRALGPAGTAPGGDQQEHANRRGRQRTSQ